MILTLDLYFECRNILSIRALLYVRFVTFCLRYFNLTTKFINKVGVENRWAEFMELFKGINGFYKQPLHYKKDKSFRQLHTSALLNTSYNNISHKSWNFIYMK